jgi:hypothetical protein
MSDITKCTNESCPLKEQCYRWTAPVEPMSQAYHHFMPTDWGTGVLACEHHIPIESDEQDPPDLLNQMSVFTQCQSK